MKKVVFLLFFILSSGLYGKNIKIAVSISPIADIVKEVVENKGEVITILPAGASPHFYDPSPQDIIRLNSSDLFIYVGKGVEPWAFKLVNSIEEIKTMELSSFIQAKNGNFHFWLSPPLMEIFVRNLIKILSKIDTVNSNYYNKNGNKIIYRLRQLDNEFSNKLSQIKNKNIIIFHNAWFYLAKRYNLKIIATIVQNSNQSLSPNEIIKIKNLIKRYKINSFFAETTSNINSVKNISQILGINYLLLDPLGNRKFPERNGYFNFMRYNLRQLLKGLK